MLKIIRAGFALGLALGILAVAAPASAQIGVAITVAPPPLPIYAQPEIPGPGYMWTPGYWGWGDGGYYWVPGTWVEPPVIGVLWTPGYWGWGGGFYSFHEGYWGPHIGFYGGINYGFGYVGTGYFGGRWDGGVFAYNRAVNNVGPRFVSNTYNTTVVNNVNVTRTSFNGGTGGVAATPTAAEREAEAGPHTPPTALQAQHVEAARQNPALYASANNGRPPVAATARPGALSGPGVVAARAAVARPPSAGGSPAAVNHVARPPSAAGAGAAGAPHPQAVAHAAAPVHTAPVSRPAPPPVRAESAPRPQAAPRGGGGHEEHR
jgi:hypothetical protein